MRFARHSKVGRALSEEFETGVFSGICKLLGCQDPYWIGVLERIARSSHDVALMLPDDSGDWVPEADLFPEENASLVAVPGGELPMVGACTVVPEVWPCERTAAVSVRNGMVEIRYAGGLSVARVREDVGGAKVFDWPSGYGVRGAVNVSEGTPAVLVLKPVYPSDFVISLVKSDSSLYTLLTGTGYAEAFYCKTDANEQLAVLVLALYKHHTANV